MAHTAPTEFPCGRCGYDLVGMPVGQKCPECGMLIVPALPNARHLTPFKPVAELPQIARRGAAWALALSITLPPIGLLAGLYAFSDYLEARRCGAWWKFNRADRVRMRHAFKLLVLSCLALAAWVVVALVVSNL